MIPINKANNNPSHNSNHLKFSDTKKKKKALKPNNTKNANTQTQTKKKLY